MDAPFQTALESVLPGPMPIALTKSRLLLTFSQLPCLLCKISFFFKLIYLIYLFLAALGLHCCARAFSSCSEQGLLFVAVQGLLIAVASLVAEHGL